MNEWPPSDTSTLPSGFQPAGSDGMPEDGPPADRLSRLGWVLSTLIFVGGLAFWIWAFSPWAPSGHPDELVTDDFPAAAEPICAATMTTISQTAIALEATDLDDRALQIETNSAILQEMVTELRTIPTVADAGDAGAIAAWLDDWDLYISDRAAYSDKFRTGLSVPFTVSLSHGDHVTQIVDRFAEVNKMNSCETPLDV